MAEAVQRSKRRPTGLLLGRMATALPMVAISMLVLVFLVRIAGGGILLVATVLAIWLLLGPTLLIARVEHALARRKSHVRVPSAPEANRLARSWRPIAQQAGIDPAGYEILIRQGRRVASAYAGSTILVSAEYVTSLPEGQLQAVLAHELGHHLERHGWASMLMYWYSLPASMVVAFATYLQLALTSALTNSSIATCLIMVAMYGLVIAAASAISPFIGLLVGLLLLLPFLSRFLSRKLELEADRIACELGCSSGLKDFLSGRSERPLSSWRHALVATHPSIAVRLQAIDRLSEDGPGTP